MDLDSALATFRAVVEQIQPLEDGDWDICSAAMSIETKEKGEFLMQPGDPGDVFFFLHKGLVKRYIITHNGDELITSFDGEKKVLSDFPSLIQNQPAEIYIECLEHCTFLQSQRGLVQSLRSENRQWQYLWQKITEMRYIQEWQRVKELLSLSAKDRYLRFMEAYKLLSDRIPQKDVAHFLGVTPTSLNRVIRQIKDEEGISD